MGKLKDRYNDGGAVAEGSGVAVVVGEGAAVGVVDAVGDGVGVSSVKARSSGGGAASTASVSVASDTPIAATNPAKAAVVPPAIALRLRVPARRRDPGERKFMMEPPQQLSARSSFNFRRGPPRWSMNPGRSTYVCRRGCNGALASLDGRLL